MAPKKRPSAAAVARATFDPHPPPLTDDATTSPRRERPLIEQARPPPAQVRVQSAQEVADRVGVTRSRSGSGASAESFRRRDGSAPGTSVGSRPTSTSGSPTCQGCGNDDDPYPWSAALTMGDREKQV